MKFDEAGADSIENLEEIAEAQLLSDPSPNVAA
jgi:hypothetical protein